MQLLPFGQLCFDDSDDDMEVDIAEVLTPSRLLGTKQPLTPMMDDDSGIGMDSDDSDNVRNVTQLYAQPAHIPNVLKERVINNDINLQISLESSFNGLESTPKFSMQRDVSILLLYIYYFEFFYFYIVINFLKLCLGLKRKSCLTDLSTCIYKQKWKRIYDIICLPKLDRLQKIDSPQGSLGRGLK